MNEQELRARMQRANAASIADLTESADACIVGIVRAIEVLQSPGTGRACVAYRFRDSEGNDQQRGVPFLIEDDTGRALIEPAGAVLVLTVRQGEGILRSVVGSQYLRKHGLGTHVEQCVDVGARIYVIGTCARELDPSAPDALYRDSPASRLRFAQHDAVALILAAELSLPAVSH